VRDDKSPGQATTLEELRHLYERQFQTKGRAGDPGRAGDSERAGDPGVE